MHWRIRSGGTVAVAMVGALLGALLGSVAAAPVAGAAPVGLGFEKTRSLVVDPGTGRVFVAGDDSVAVLDGAGTLLTTIPGMFGAWGMDTAQGYVWVNESGDDSIAKIDPVTMTVVHTYNVGAPVGDNLAIVGGNAWIGNRDSRFGSINVFDLATSTLSNTGYYNYYEPGARRIGSSTTELVVYERGISYGPMHRIANAAPYTESAKGQGGSGLKTLTITDDGTRAWGGAYFLEEFDGTTLGETGIRYPSTPPTVQTAWSPAHGGLVLGLTASTLSLYRVGQQAAVATVAVTNPNLNSPVALSPDGNTAYLLTTEVEVLDLRPALTGTSPSMAVRDVPTTVSLTGHSLGGTSAITVGGIGATIIGVSPAKVTFTLPAGVPTGSQPVVVTGPTGTVSTSLTVTANSGATLGGIVDLSGGPLVGAELTLSGGGLSSPLSITTDESGSYQFPPVGHGTSYVLSAHDPAGNAPDQTLHNIALIPNDPKTLDLDLSKPAPDGAELARTALGSGTANDLVVDPTTGNVIVAIGDEVDILAEDGTMLARVRGLYGAASLSLMGGDVFVGMSAAARVARIDLDTRTVIGSWALNSQTEGTIAAAAGKIWFADGDGYDGKLASLNLETGAITVFPDRYLWLSLRAVSGSASLFTATETQVSNYPTTVLDGSVDPPRRVAYTDKFAHSITPTAPLAAVSGTNHLFDSTGHEFKLSTLVADGVQYEAAGFPAYSPGLGGVVAFGTRVAREGTPTVTHAFGGTSDATGLSIDGMRLYTVSGNDLVVEDLAPHVVASSPEVLHPNINLRLTGSGLGSVTSASIDGSPVAFASLSTGSVRVPLSDLSPGMHELRITTPWGTTPKVPLDIHAPTVPIAPAKPAVTLHGADVRVTWTAPIDDGGKAITGYEVSGHPGAATCTTTGALMCDVTGLTPATSHTFTVTATNEIGTGPASPASAPIVTPTPPDPPTNLVATAGPSRARVTWTAPVVNGGSPITEYQVCWSTDPTVPVETATCTTSSGTVANPDLTAHVTYYFTAEAINAAGTGLRSSVSNPVTPFGAPSEPTAVVVTPGRMSAGLSWTASADDGGSPLTGYRICASTSAFMPATSATVCQNQGTTTTGTVTGLAGGGTYYFTVAGRNAAGTGQASAVTSGDIPVSTPAPPTFVHAHAGLESISLNWTNAATGGSPITGYEVCVAADPTMPAGSTTCTAAAGPASATLANLAPGVTVYVTVAAVNSVGTGARSAVSNGVNPYTYPGVPTAVVAVAGDTQATLTWTGPAFDGGFDVTSYRITPYSGATALTTVTSIGRNTSYVFAGLTNGTAYTFKVVAVSGLGPGPLSAASNTVTPTDGSVPGAARYVAVVPCRVVDTRVAGGALASGVERDFAVTGSGSLASQGGAVGGCGVPVGAVAVEASVTAVAPSGVGYARLWPAGSSMPNATFLNFGRGQAVTNTGALSLAGSGAKQLSLRSFGGPSGYMIDILGYYTTN